MKGFKSVATAAVIGYAEAQLDLPPQFKMAISNMMPTVNMTFQGNIVNDMVINPNSDNSTAYFYQCYQDLFGTGEPVHCTAPPTNVHPQLNETELTGIGQTFTGFRQGGYRLDGRMVSGSFALELDDGTTTQSQTTNIYGVTQITDDSWGWNREDGSGEVALGPNTPVVQQLEMFSRSAVILETGPIVDQSFAGGQPIDETLQVLRIGGGVNANTFNSTAKTTISLAQNDDKTYNLKAAGFGKINWDIVSDTPGSGYFHQLGYPN